MFVFGDGTFTKRTSEKKKEVKNLWEQLVTYSESDYYPFHMPGHKRFPKENALACYKCFPKESAPPCYKRLEYLYQYDITEIEGFDNLHDAKDLLLALQQKAAGIYHAEQSFFLINGSTGGILSAVSAVAEDGKKLLIARNCHKSVYNAVVLNRLQTEYLYPQVIEDFAVQGEITAKQVQEYLAGRRDICGVVITSPTYDGVISDIREIAKAVHACHIPLIVDEAHGAHFALSENAPESAVQCGADIVINSVHKTLPALTQTALLHVQGSLIDREKLKNYLGMYQSSSPSYLLMASIDQCMDFIAEEGEERYAGLLALRDRVDQAAAAFSCIRLMPAGERRDAGKLVISVKETGMTGWELYRILLEKYHLQMEMAAPDYVLGILSVMDTEEGIERLTDALAEIDREISGKDEKCAGIKNEKKRVDMYNIERPVSVLSIYEAIQREKEWIFPEEAGGRISGGFLFFYPPGIPFLVPGEVVSEEIICKIRQCRESKEYMTGISDDGKLCVLKCCKLK